MGGLDKNDDLLLAVAGNAYDIIVMVESNLNGNYHDCELRCEGFTLYRNDRSATTSRKMSGGGVIMYVSNKILSQCGATILM